MTPIGARAIPVTRTVARTALRVSDRLAGALDPWLLLATRIWLAQAFLLLQVTMQMSGQSLTAALAGSWWASVLQHAAATGFGGAVEALCPVLLALGLLSRPAAFAMLLQVLLLHHVGSDETLRWFWAVLLAGLLVMGPGALSLDRLLGPGVANSALPAMRFISAIIARVTASGTPTYLLGLRALVVVVVFVHLATAPNGVSPTGAQQGAAMHEAAMHMQAMDLPKAPGLISALPSTAALAIGVLLIAGFAVRPTALLLIFLAPVGATATIADTGFYWLLLLGILFVKGSGALGLDRALRKALRSLTASPDPTTLPHVVVVGGGFGGLSVARYLGGTPCRVTLIDKRNYHLFQPLLYQVATAGLSPADIANPIRGMLRAYPNVRVLLGEVTGVDTLARTVCLGESRVPFDTLVLATGAQHSYFGRDDWSHTAPGLKTIEDATAIRRRLLVAFEAAEAAEDSETRAAWLTFVIVGGGPTGVELAGAIAELARFGMADEFRAIDPATARVVLVQSAPRLLPSFPESLSQEAAAALRRLGVEVLLDHKAKAIDATGVTTDSGHMPARTVLWAAGVQASPAARWLGVAGDRAGRVPVAPDLRVPGFGDVFAIGDTCASKAWKGEPVPGLAPAAKQAGAYVGQVIVAGLHQRPAPTPFAYRHFGSLATIGRKAAVAEFGTIRVKGALAWWLWGATHVLFLIDGRSRAGVVLEWLWDYFTLRRGTRLIVGPAQPNADSVGT